MRIAHRWISASLAMILGAAAVGCGGRSTIPSGAHQETAGPGHISFTASQPGNVYVLDEDKNRKVFEGHVNNGDQVIVQPNQDRIVLRGDNAPHGESLNPNHRYGIYFIGG